MVLNPPQDVLSSIQTEVVNFFWDKMHWIPQAMLFLPKEEGGQGLVHLASRVAAFRLQFLQRLLVGPTDLLWKPLAYVILQNLGGLKLDLSLFLMDPKRLPFKNLPSFYRGLFKVLCFFQTRRCEFSISVPLLLKEPLIRGGKFDLSRDVALPLDNILESGGLKTLGDLVSLAGPKLEKVEPVASVLNMRSTRIVAQLLNKWKKIFSKKECDMLGSLSDGSFDVRGGSLFPKFNLIPLFDECVGPLLNVPFFEKMYLDETDGKGFYKVCVKVLNKPKLNARVDTPWRVKLGLDENVKPNWRVLYKPPLSKKYGDLQWRILHGVIPVNSFVSVLNPEVDDDCPSCAERERDSFSLLHGMS